MILHAAVRESAVSSLTADSCVAAQRPKSTIDDYQIINILPKWAKNIFTFEFWAFSNFDIPLIASLFYKPVFNSFFINISFFSAHTNIIYMELYYS